MIKFEYTPAQPDKTWGYAQDIPPVEDLTMTLGDDVSWDEATKEFHNFLRAAGYVIPYDFEEEADEDDYDQTALELCNNCGWKTVTPDDGCLNCIRREWVGLEDTAYAVGKFYTPDFLAGAKWAEERLKEKNT